MEALNLEDSGLFIANGTVVPATAIARWLDEYSGTCFALADRSLDYSSELPPGGALCREQVGGEKHQEEMRQYLVYQRAANLHYQGETLKNVLTRIRTKRIVPVTEFARRVEALRSRPGVRLDVSNITPEGTRDKQIDTKTSKQLRGHPSLPLVSKTYEAYATAVALLPGDFSDVLAEVAPLFPPSGKVVSLASVGENFYGAETRLDLPEPAVPEAGEVAEHATGIRTVPFLRFDKRKQEIDLLEKAISEGRIEEQYGSQKIAEIIGRKPITGTVLEPLHEISEQDAQAIREAEPSLASISTEKVKADWRSFAFRGSRATVYAPNFALAFDPFVRYILDKLKLKASPKAYVLQ